MNFEKLPIDGAYLIRYHPLEDNRGSFTRVFCVRELEKIGLDADVKQINHSKNILKGTLRGLHYQIFPATEAKLIRVIKGRIFDVIVDLRRGSPTYLKHYSVILSDSEMSAIYIPQGCGHGFQTLEDNTELLYHHTDFYQPGLDRGIRFNDPILNIEWPLAVSCISDRDLSYPYLTPEFNGI